MKKYFKEWNKFEITLLIFSIFLLLGLGIYLKCGLLPTIVPFLGFFSALHQAKGLVLGQITGVVMAILYSIMSYSNQYYGEVIIYIVVILPLYISGIYTWLKNKDNHVIKLSTLNENSLWQIFSVYSLETESYYITTEFKNDADFQKYINKSLERSMFDLNVDKDVIVSVTKLTYEEIENFK